MAASSAASGTRSAAPFSFDFDLPRGCGHLRATLDGEPVAPVRHLHAHVAPAHAAHRLQPVLVHPLDQHALAHLGQLRHQVEGRVAPADPPAPRGLFLAAAQAQRLRQRVTGLALAVQVAARAVSLAPLPLQHQRRPLAGREHRAQLHRAHAQPHLHGARGQQLEPHDHPAVRRRDRARPRRRELHVHRLLQRLQPRGERVVRLGRKRRRGQRQRPHDGHRLRRHLRQQHLRRRRFGAVQVDEVPAVAQSLRRPPTPAASPQQIELRRQATVGRRREAQAQPPLPDVQPPVALLRAVVGARAILRAARALARKTAG